jgi:hypothetical protein
MDLGRGGIMTFFAEITSMNALENFGAMER